MRSARLVGCDGVMGMVVRLVGMVAAGATLALPTGCADRGLAVDRNSTRDRSLQSPSASDVGVAAAGAVGRDDADRGSGSAGPGSGRDALPPAVVAGVSVDRGAMFSRLAEGIGGVVLEEMALDRLLQEEARRRGITITQADLRAERTSLVAAIREASDLAGPDAEEALLGVRRRRGLGPQRFDALLRRNAILRQIASQNVVVNDNDIRLAHRIRYGERVMVSILVTPDERGASRARARIVAGESFAQVASEVSIDPSASAGGRAGPLSPFDPALPDVLTTALRQMSAGQLSPVIAGERGYLIVRIDEQLPARPTPIDAVRDALASEIRRVRERAEMDRVARSFLDLAQITVFDPSLRWSWESVPRGGVGSGG